MSAPAPARVVVVGGGVAGLAAAHALAVAEARPAVWVCEASRRFGGHLRTERDGELLIEAGPDSLVTRKPAAVELCRELGLGDGLVAAPITRPAAQVVHRGRLHDLPGGTAMAVPEGLSAWVRDRLYSPRGKARLWAERFVAARDASGEGEDESLGDLVTRRLGREAFDRVVEPVFGGLFTGDAARFSARLVAPGLVELERRWGSLAKGARAARADASQRSAARPGGTVGSPGPSQVTLRAGLGALADALVDRLVRAGRNGDAGSGEPGRVVVECGVEVVGVRGGVAGRGFVVELRGRDPLACDAVVLAVPGPVLAGLTRGLDPELARAAGELEYADCATIALAYPRSGLLRDLSGLGLFVPRTEGTPVLAVSYASEKFPGRAPSPLVLLRVFVGGALHPEALAREDRELVELAARHVERWLGLDARPTFSRVDRHAYGIPQLVVGCGAGRERQRAALARHPGLFVAGSALGIYGVPDCVESGRTAAAAALRALADPSAVVHAGGASS